MKFLGQNHDQECQIDRTKELTLVATTDRNAHNEEAKN